jgi:hypothetical protein
MKEKLHWTGVFIELAIVVVGIVVWGEHRFQRVQTNGDRTS